ncbi:MAG: two component, sigma54 specific, transcriptional regulator, Fis family [Rhodocyclales bacterium]|nr:two component, sigma54 specific, transcriptional regulator, Fis family [Rhodocyclales bacterium]
MTSSASSASPPSSLPSLLIVDDDPLIVDTLRYVLEREFELLSANSRSAAIATVRQRGGHLDVALIDLGLPPLTNRPDEGLALISELLAHDPHCKIIVLSGQNEEAHARHARTLGALEFIAKPAQPELLRAALQRAQQLRKQELAVVSASQALERIVGESPVILAARAQLRRFAGSHFPVLIEGESGAGKEVAAQALHELSGAQRRFVALNCAAIAPGLIEATLFGHTRGAFTGAQAAQAGYFEEAADGTLFLDEIGELPLELQPKLLRVLENGEYQRVGETQKRIVRARIIAATNRDLQQEVRGGRFRADLFHRLSVLRVRMPALRQTGDDKLILLDHYKRIFSEQMGLPPFRITPDALQCWLAYDFPGNVRELRNIVIRLLVRYAGQTVGREELEAEQEADVVTKSVDIDSAAPVLPAPGTVRDIAPSGVDLPAVLRRVERDYIAAALQQSHGNMSQAARLLGINRSTLYNRMETLARHGEDFGTAGVQGAQ